ncbi:MAG: HAMP domain-containing protein [Elusimicrobiaceae bacterium]|nr:HAMP domain-containing protein [Elusimicrobiaceae bacterium]
MAKKHFNSLFSQAIVVLVLISIIPVFIIGFHVLGVDSRILKNEILQKQQSVARRILATASSMLTYQEQLLAVFLDLHTSGHGSSVFNREDLNYLRKSAPAFLYVTLLDAQGNELFFSGSPLSDTLSVVKQELLSTCLQQKPYISDIFRVEDHFFVWLAEPFHQADKDGVLAVAYDLSDMGKTLLQSYPLDMNIAFVSAAGDLISYNGASEGLAFTPNPELEQKVQDMDRALGSKTEGEVVLPSNERILVSVAQWPAMEWAVYVDQPADLITHLLRENFSWDMGVLLLTMLFFLLVISYWVILPITRPLVRLREAATRLRDQEDVVLTEADVDIPNNEIGELALIVVEMSHELHNRRQRLLQAQTELAQSNQILEKRVEERTNALRQATRELVKSERLAAIGQMASIISHEIRNPLAVISNATRLIKMLVRTPDAKVTKQFGIIEAEIRQANSIISEVLGYARSRD